MKHEKKRASKRTARMRKTFSLRELRKTKGLTLQKVSEQTEIPISTIQALETGRGKNYDVGLKHKLSDFYRVPMLSIFPEERERIELIQGKMRQVQLFIPRENVNESK